MGIKLSSNYVLPKEGTDIWKIESVENKEDFGKLKIVFVNADGVKQFENYSFYKDIKAGVLNDGALNAFSWMARKALGLDGSFEGEVEPNDLIGKYVEAECSITATDEGKKFAHLSKWESAEGFDREEKEKPVKKAAVKEKKSSDALDFLD